MILVILLLVFLTVDIECILTHMLLTTLLLSTTLLVIRELHHMTLVFSTAHTFHCKWFVQLVRILSNQKLDLRQDMVLLKIHLLLVMQQMLLLVQMITLTTEEFKSPTLCNNKKRFKRKTKGEFLLPFFYT